VSTSTPRRQRAEKTRQRICEAGKQLFLSRGYAATTITDLARAAGVAPQTVYFTFGSKATVLSAIMDAEVVGDLDAVPLLQRPQVRRIADITDPVRRLERVVAVSCDITHRVAPLYEIVRGGAASGEDVADVLDRHEERRWQTLRAFAGLLADDLAPGIDAGDATDRLYALLSHDVYWLLVHRCRWTVARWRRHVTELATRSLLDGC
jgi:AcrR family transcriptional regulator